MPGAAPECNPKVGLEATEPPSGLRRWPGSPAPSCYNGGPASCRLGCGVRGDTPLGRDKACNNRAAESYDTKKGAAINSTY